MQPNHIQLLCSCCGSDVKSDAEIKIRTYNGGVMLYACYTFLAYVLVVQVYSKT